jgi:PilZ domain
VVLPVRVWGTDSEGQPFSEIVHTLDVSSRGARLGGFHGTLKPGETVGIQYRNQRVRFRVAWIKAGEKELQFGIDSLQPEKEIWGAKLAAGYKDDYVVPAAPSQRRYEKRKDDRRRHTRFPVTGAALVSNLRGVEQRSLPLRDISLEGCFIETGSPSPVNTQIKLLVKIEELEVEAFGVVRASFPSTAMGVQFTQMSPPDSDRLKIIIKRLEMREATRTASADADLWEG